MMYTIIKELQGRDCKGARACLICKAVQFSAGEENWASRTAVNRRCWSEAVNRRCWSEDQTLLGQEAIHTALLGEN
jgi:hypothetical protein